MLHSYRRLCASVYVAQCQRRRISVSALPEHARCDVASCAPILVSKTIRVHDILSACTIFNLLLLCYCSVLFAACAPGELCSSCTAVAGDDNASDATTVFFVQFRCSRIAAHVRNLGAKRTLVVPRLKRV